MAREKHDRDRPSLAGGHRRAPTADDDQRESSMTQSLHLRRAVRQLGVIGLLAVLAGAVTACSSTGPATPTSGGSSPAASSPAGPSTTASGTGTPAPTGSGPVPLSTPLTAVPGGSLPAGTAEVLTGTLEEGVEAGCVVLVGPDGAVQALLIGVDTATAPFGSSVQVTGKFQRDMMTTCQQGEPFAVATLQVL